MSATTVAHPSVEERKAAGKDTRERVAPSDHAGVDAAPRTDPTRSRCSRSRTRPGSRTWCRSGTGA